MPVERIEKPKELKNIPIFKPGYWVAVTLRDKVSPMDCYVGEIQAVDEHGVRITLINWLIGAASGFDLFMTWEQIAVALVATEQHDLEGFVQAAGNFQMHTHERTGYAAWKEQQQKEKSNNV